MNKDMVKIALVEDMESDIRRLASVLDDYSASRNISLDYQLFRSGEDFLADYLPLRYTIVFLDIYMDGITGIETARRIREVDEDTIIIFMTSSEEDMGKAFYVHAFDYIAKDSGPERIYHALDSILLCRGGSSKGSSVSAADKRHHC